MREVVVVSGKGGTGKTSLTAAFACLSENSVLCDGDVDAADLHLLLEPTIQQNNDFYAGGLANIDQDACTQCGQCLTLCKFGAIKDSFEVDPIRCEGCGVCVDLCPVSCIEFPERKCGQWFVSDTKHGTMVHAKLGIGQENSGRLVSLIRKEAQEIAIQQSSDLLITDGPPGIGCPVIAAITGATVLLVVVEPTVSGAHDMARVVKLANHFKLPTLLCVNKYDLNNEMSEQIIDQAEQLGVKFAGKIPFDTQFTHAMVASQTVVEFDPDSDSANAIKQVWNVVEEASAGVNQPVRII